MKVTVKPAQVFTDTGVTVKAGDSVTITASGRMHFGGGKIASLTPGGHPVGPGCDAIASQPGAQHALARAERSAAGR